jgi:hypothetical protein
MFSMFVSCNKVEIDEPPVQGSPVFKVNATFGSEPLELEAGEGNCELESYVQNENGANVHCGKLSGTDYTVKLKIFDGALDLPNGKFQTLLPQILSFTPSNGNSFIHIDPSHFPNYEHIEQISWYVDGVFHGTDYLDISSPGKYSVCADVLFDNGSNSMVCNEFLVGFRPSSDAFVRHFVDQQLRLHAWIDAYEKNVEFVHWYVDGNLVSEEESIILQLNPALHKVMAEIHFTNGAVRKKTVLADGTLQGCFLDDLTIFETFYTGQYNDFTVQLEISFQGELYTTRLCPNESSSFDVSEWTYYGKDSAGKSVYKITADVDCILSNSSGDELPFSGNIIFGLPGE